MLGGPGSYFWQGMLGQSVSVVENHQNQSPNIPSSYSVFSPCLPLGQVISAAKEEIIKAYYPGYFMQAVEGQIQTKQVQAAHDDSYQGTEDRFNSAL